MIYEKVDHFYTATKHVVKALTEGLRMEIRQQGLPIKVTVNYRVQIRMLLNVSNHAELSQAS